MSKIYKKPPHCKAIGDHQKYLTRITKTLYYGKLPKADSLSLPVTELAVEIFSDAQKGKSLERLHCDDAARISRNACVSPCSLVLAILYFERLKQHNPEYLEKTAPSDLFLVSLMVSSKFLFDDGESDEVFIDEWAASGGLEIRDLVQLERDFLQAIDWEIYVNKLLFWKKLNQIETEVARREGTSRGYFTYTELQNLASIVEIYNIIHCVVTVSVILAATYTAGFLMLHGSVFLASRVPGTSLYSKEVENQESINILAEYDDKTGCYINCTVSDDFETEFNSKYRKRNLDVVNVLKTSILLSTIKSINAQTDAGFETISCNNSQMISWDWWNIPVMNWLTRTSEFMTSLDIPVHYFLYFLESKVTNLKHIDLEDHIQKATKTRIQDQMESSWHKEWTDTIKYNIYYSKVFSYMQNMKS